MNKSNHVIRIICEGFHTEALFFNSLRDDILDERYKLDNVVIKIKPEPIIETEDNNTPVSQRGKYLSKPRKTKKKEGEIDEEIIKGTPPLCWVNAGIQDLKDGIDEVWTVFDKDRHPKIKEAFEAAEEKVNGKCVNIAFSSICFEYFLLIHFEKIYKVFEKSECNEKEYIGQGRNYKSKTVLFNCCTSKAFADKACNGDKCVNGYARLKKYWMETKKDVSTYSFVKDKLVNGICNSVWLRKMSEQNEHDAVFYNRNPYVTTDKLIERLIGYKYIDKGKEFVNVSKTKFIFKRKEDGSIKLINNGKTTLIIGANSFEVLDEGTCTKTGNRYVLYPEDECAFEELDYEKADLIYIFSFEGLNFIFHNYL